MLIRLMAVSMLSLVPMTSDGVAEPLRIEGEHFRYRPVGAAQETVWNLWSNGAAGDYVEVSRPGTCRISIWAAGTPVAGVWPLVAVAIDDVHVAMLSITNDVQSEYSADVELAAGTHRVAVCFLNDLMRDGEDRNVYVDAMTIQTLDGAGTVVLADAATWERNWREESARLERETLQRAELTIEQHRKRDFRIRVVDECGAPVPNIRVTVRQQSHDFLFGCNFFGYDGFDHSRYNRLYRERFRQLFNYATLGFYWRQYEPERGRPNYAYTDRVLDWCDRFGIATKGHPLLWDHDAGVPQWSVGQPETRVQEQRVREIVGRYRGRVNAWEVVNEPAHLPRIAIDAPYRWAREADPEATLIVNDYEVMANGFRPFYELLETAIETGVPFDGIGIQAHEPRTMRFPLDRVWRVLDTYAVLGKPIHITEFTPATAGQRITGSHVEGVWDEESQAEYAAKFYTVCFAHPAVAAITWWDLSDASSWLKGGGLLREDFSRKPAYDALDDLINRKWKTNLVSRTDPHGVVSGRGFLGTYEVVVRSRGKVYGEQFSLDRGASVPCDFVISIGR